MECQFCFSENLQDNFCIDCGTHMPVITKMEYKQSPEHYIDPYGDLEDTIND